MLKIFLVEDDATIQRHLSELLLHRGNMAVVGTATGEQEAVHWLLDNRNNWDLGIVDLLLAHGNGLGVLSSCRVRSPHQRMAVLSNHLSSAARRRCQDFGANAIFDKTTGLTDLLAYCESLSRAYPAS